MTPCAIERLEATVKNYTEEYGDVIFIKEVVTSTTKDVEGIVALCVVKPEKLLLKVNSNLFNKKNFLNTAHTARYVKEVIILFAEFC
ncbi:hypothetical protein Ltuc_0926 [Legionella tucsonensis]|uniref:Uncharacterized protein n=2 Tax=Legionella tucsonensis TaxID=40335 RepID=A0A0W0ZVD7_9GAMM|nr:hypothetical protein Ltuc_0926 [Legionella tucsonensis]